MASLTRHLLPGHSILGCNILQSGSSGKNIVGRCQVVGRTVPQVTLLHQTRLSRGVHTLSKSFSHPARRDQEGTRGVASASKKDDSSSDSGQDLWRQELAGFKEGEDIWEKEEMQEDIERLTKRRAFEKLKAANYQESLGEAAGGGGGDGGLSVKSVVDKVLVADFFFILAVLAWFLAGIVQRTALADSSLLDAWLPLWGPVIQPALGLFMGAAILSAVSGFLNKAGSD